MNSQVSYDCQTCGACCHSPWTGDGYVLLYDIDLERLQGTGLPVVAQEAPESGEVILKLSTRIDAASRRICVAFAGSVGQSCACQVYDRRPEACRRFEVGGVLCREARQRHDLPL